MADDKTLTAEGEDDELVMVEVASEEERIAALAAPAKPEADAGAEGDEDDDEAPIDARLADEDDEDEGSPGKKERQKRRQRQKAARDAAQARLLQLETRNATLEQRLAALEGGHVHTNKALNDRAIEEAKGELARAERIIAAAIDAGAGDDAIEAQKLRDEARDRVRALEDFGKTLDVPARAAPVANAQAAAFQKSWLEANPWFKADGSDEDSAITIAIDNRVRADGFDPGSVEYWNELTTRVARRLAGSASPRKTAETTADAPAPREARRKGPPMGDSRTHAPASTRKEVYVTPERKQAMQDAGYWDDPVKRAQMLKSYAAHDRANPVR